MAPAGSSRDYGRSERADDPGRSSSRRHRSSGHSEYDSRRHDRDYAPRRDYGRNDRSRGYEDGERRDRDRQEDYGRDRGHTRDGRRGSERRDQERKPSRRSASPPSHSSKPRESGSRSRSRSVADKEKDKAKPNFNPSGLLAAATKTVEHGDGTKTVLKYHEPPEARKPLLGWRLYVFKGKEQTDVLHIHRQSAYLVGRDRSVADIPVEHPSCSKQHAVIQFRQVMEKNEFGESKQVIKPFIIDLESTNGTAVNDEQIPTSRYYELQASDVIKFGDSLREYVLLHDEAA
ncbi:SMAD/FHA domain-containing protein [Heliocybe sulcata]|uniref:SMAD/FHA domain-containing protein n=1 Tax=Heliocybe sulcata TaxID=5364 RepID=A0A5C3NG21_9AGAM|nr:SMAD/FHA domain-containing protein [Heliocybe sulcata]